MEFYGNESGAFTTLHLNNNVTIFAKERLSQPQPKPTPQPKPRHINQIWIIWCVQIQIPILLIIKSTGMKITCIIDTGSTYHNSIEINGRLILVIVIIFPQWL